MSNAESAPLFEEFLTLPSAPIDTVPIQECIQCNNLLDYIGKSLCVDCFQQWQANHGKFNRSNKDYVTNTLAQLRTYEMRYNRGNYITQLIQQNLLQQKGQK